MSNDLKQAIATMIFIAGLVIAVASFVHPKGVFFGFGIAGLWSAIAAWQLVGHHQRDRMARGRRLLSFREAAKKSETERKKEPGDRGVLFGNVRIPTSNARWHFCITGAVGSGKTLTIRMMMRDQLPLITKGSKRRAMIYDAKQDMVQNVISALEEMSPSDGPAPVVRLLNPFDTRANAWNMAADVTSLAAARQFATTLVPDSEESQPFFTDAVRELLIGVLLVFIRTRPGRWTFRELLLVMASKDKLYRLLSRFDYTRDVAENFLSSGDKTVGSIMATVATKLGPFGPIAAAWEHARKANGAISISKWLEEESILILGNDERIRSSLDVVNQLFVAITAQHVLSQPDNDDQLTWFFFDEFREAGKLRGLESIILRGRSKGCAVVLGFQDIHGVHHVYDKDLGNELVGQCGNKAFLRIESSETAEWASKSVGEYEAYEYDQSWQRSQQGHSKTVSASRKSRDTVLASEFMSTPVTSKTTGLEGVYLIRSVGAFRARYSPEELNTNLGYGRTKKAAFKMAPKDWQYLENLSEEDDVRIGIREKTPQSNEAASPPAGSSASQKKRSSLDDIGRMGP